MTKDIVYTSDDGPVPTFFHELRAIFPCLDGKAMHPETGQMEYVHNIIIELNDDFYWTRHQIADWLESLYMDISRSDKYEYLDHAHFHRDEEGTKRD